MTASPGAAASPASTDAVGGGCRPRDASRLPSRAVRPPRRSSPPNPRRTAGRPLSGSAPARSDLSDRGTGGARSPTPDQHRCARRDEPPRAARCTRTLQTSSTPTPPVSGSMRATSSPHRSSVSHPISHIFADFGDHLVRPPSRSYVPVPGTRYCSTYSRSSPGPPRRTTAQVPRHEITLVHPPLIGLCSTIFSCGDPLFCSPARRRRSRHPDGTPSQDSRLGDRGHR